MSDIKNRYIVMRLLILFSLLSLSFCQRKSCPNICVPLPECKPLQDLLKSGTRANVNKVRNEICGFRGLSTLVCCSDSSTGIVTDRPFIIGTPGTPAPIRKLTREEKKKLLPNDICGRPSTDDKVLGGEPAPIGAYPWVAALGYTVPGKSGNKFDCGGSLINSRYVLTAAHCLDEKYLSGRTLTVIHLGDNDLQSQQDCQIVPVLNIPRCAPPHIVVKPEKVVIHNQFDTRKRFSDDIGLIRIDRELNFRTINSYVAPICIPPSNLKARTITGGRDTIAAGWGFTEDNSQSDVLLRVNLPLADEVLCTNRYKDQFLSEQLCVGGNKGKDTCSGDSGGPLIVAGPFGPPYLQIGIVSYGPFPCGLAQTPGVYTSVSNYIDWILDNIEP